MHRGYVYAGASGAYTFTVPAGIDDALYAWVGEAAAAPGVGWTLDNAAVRVGLGQATPVTFVYAAVAGEFIPLRIEVVQVTSAWAFSFTITGPDGAVIMDRNGQTDALVQFGCDGATGAWLPWGQE